MKLTLFKLIPTLAAFCALAFNTPARASTAYGSINNFDVVNDTGKECHGFEIELEDCNSTDITYTYDWNHYGKSKFIPTTTTMGKPATCVRWESAKKPDGTWAAFTAIPAGPIQPTDGHQFTNPNVNFGGEHFGVGYTKNPTAVRYFWLLDDGAGGLVRGPEVQVSTPVFNYLPAGGGAVAQVQAVIQPVVPELPEPKEFGDAVWVKEIRTTTHNNKEVKLRDLVSDDPDDADDKNWRNGEPDEVEVEWQLLQTDYNKADGGKNGELAAAPEDLDNGDEVVTRRYEFFKYIGPFDDESGEAMAENVGADNVHGDGVKIIKGVEVDLSTIEVVGEYIGAQMAAFDPAAEVGLIDQIPDGDLNAEYPARRVIIAGAAPFTATTEGELPAGMSFDTVTGVLSGTPTEAGIFSLIVNAQEGALPVKTKTFSFIIAGAIAPPPQSTVDTSALPADGGTTTGGGIYDNGTNITVHATAAAGFAFVSWSDNGNVVSNSASYTFITSVNRSLVANFAPTGQNFTVSTSASPANLGTTGGDGTFAAGASVTVNATANAGAAFVAWTEGGTLVSSDASYTFSVAANRALVANFVPVFNITASASPAAGGTTSGEGPVNGGSNVTVTATANVGYAFVNWTEGGIEVSTATSYSFTATANRALVANFVPVYTIATASAPAQGGNTSGGGAANGGTAVTVTAAANAGFVFVNWTEGGTKVSASPSYTFTVSADRALVANFRAATVVIPVGTFNGTVANIVSPAAEGTGLIKVTTSGSRGRFTATLHLGGKRSAFRGGFDAAGNASVNVRRRGASPLVVQLHADAVTGIGGTVSAGQVSSTFSARRCPYSAANRLAEWPGTYTHMIGFPKLNLPSLPVGTGTHVISASGAVRTTGKLSDGSSYTCASLVTDAGAFPLYSPTKLPGFGGFIASDVALDSASLGSIVEGSPLTWQPATAQAFGRFRFHADRYTPPARGQTALKVDARVHNLNVFTANSIGGWHGAWQMLLRSNNVATDLHTGPSAISLRIEPRSGAMLGRLHDGVTTRPFTGVVWQSSNIGFAVLPGYGDQATLKVVAIYTGP